MVDTGKTAKTIQIDYTNHRGERAWRTITPYEMYWGTCQCSPNEGWIIKAFCHDRMAERHFALLNIHAVRAYV